jgi:hypothetical protein
MTDPAIELLREPQSRECRSPASPGSLIAALQQSVDESHKDTVALFGEFSGSSFMVAIAPKGGRTPYPIALWGSVEPDGSGSRVSYRSGLTAVPRKLLRLWAAISVVLLILSVVMVGAALVMADWGSIPFGFIPAGLVGLVWWTWRRVGNQRAVLERWLARRVLVAHDCE